MTTVSGSLVVHVTAQSQYWPIPPGDGNQTEIAISGAAGYQSAATTPVGFRHRAGADSMQRSTPCSTEGAG